MNDENNKEPHDKAVDEEVAREMEGVPEHLRDDGEAVEEWAEGLYAVCIQHEMDHLDGTLFIDYLSRLKRQRAVDKVRKARRQKARDHAA